MELRGEMSGKPTSLDTKIQVVVTGTDRLTKTIDFIPAKNMELPERGCIVCHICGIPDWRAVARCRNFGSDSLEVGEKTGGFVLKEAIKLVANNKKAYHDYFIDEKFECGIELFGTEVKSIRMGKCSVKEAFVRIDKNEVYIYGMHINPYEKGNIFNKDPLRARKLLMHRSEINKLEGKIREKGLTLVPLQVYFKGSLVKVEIGLARGKKLYDKRDDIAKKDQRREVERDYKQKLR